MKQEGAAPRVWAAGSWEKAFLTGEAPRLVRGATCPGSTELLLGARRPESAACPREGTELGKVGRGLAQTLCIP